MSKHLFTFLSLLLFAFPAVAQQPFPAALKPALPAKIRKPLADLLKPQQPVEVTNSLPALFKETKPNVLCDITASLFPFWEKLRLLREPSVGDRPTVRVVHLGDSHIRAHILTSVTRVRMEETFGVEAVHPDTVNYHTRALARETGLSGIVYHAIGINGATCVNFTNVMQAEEVAGLSPDLIILSFGTNESHGRGYNAAIHYRQIDDLVKLLKEYCPQATFLLTTPPGSHVRSRKRKIINPRTPLAVQTIEKYACEQGMAYWNLYTICGGQQRACLNWIANNMMQRDRVHYTVSGYKLQGNLLYEALIKAYNDYVAN